jgi:hypothetical protein
LKILKKILLVIGILAIIGFTIILDIADRGKVYSKNITINELNEFYLNKNQEERKSAFEKHFGFGKYKFPREQVVKIKLFRNNFLTSRLTSITVSELNKSDLITFFNNPSNFHWSETTWNLSESEYILRFYNKENKEIGKVWLCIEGCGMTESEPFSPNMKYGGISKKGKEKLNYILNEILTE